MKFQNHGIGVDLPNGWEGQILISEEKLAVVHVCNWRFVRKRLPFGTFGEGLLPAMPPGGILIALVEYGPELVGHGAFKTDGLSLPIKMAELSRDCLPDGGQSNQAGVQRVFSSHGRSFCLFLAVNTAPALPARLEAANSVLGTISVRTPANEDRVSVEQPP